MSTKVPRPPVDWEAIEREYRLGKRSNLDLAKEFGCSEGAIRKRAKRDLWPKDLSAKVRARAEQLVRAEEVRTQVRAEFTADERGAVESDAVQMAAAEVHQRQDVSEARALVRAMVDELRAVTGNKELFEQVGEILDLGTAAAPDKLNEVYRAVISFPGRVDAMKKLGDALCKLIDLERRVLRMDETGTASPWEAALERAFANA